MTRDAAGSKVLILLSLVVFRIGLPLVGNSQPHRLKPVLPNPPQPPRARLTPRADRLHLRYTYNLVKIPKE